MTRPGGPSSADQKLADAALAAHRARVRYRVDGVALDWDVEPDWDAMSPWTVLEKYLYGAGWTPVMPVKPVMAGDVVRPEIRTHFDRAGKKRSETVYPLEGPIWPPRVPS